MDIEFQSIRDAIELAEDTGTSAKRATETLVEIKQLSKTVEEIPAPEIKLAASELLAQVASIQVANATLIQRLSVLAASLGA
ncbi:MAG: hypothetical protein ABJZ79_00670, partial [Parasphingorhabdus sp.]|uniref:hypothetical protein n=1 Tax=Parasphingorhabdus sp. TaxID=2709688 RepID=UPI00329775B3